MQRTTLWLAGLTLLSGLCGCSPSPDSLPDRSPADLGAAPTAESSVAQAAEQEFQAALSELHASSPDYALSEQDLSSLTEEGVALSDEEKAELQAMIANP